MFYKIQISENIKQLIIIVSGILKLHLYFTKINVFITIAFNSRVLNVVSNTVKPQNKLNSKKSKTDLISDNKNYQLKYVIRNMKF